MTNPNVDAAINHVLYFVEKWEPQGVSLHEIRTDFIVNQIYEDKKFVDYVIKKMRTLELINLSQGETVACLAIKGHEIQYEGGWIKHIGYEKEKREETLKQIKASRKLTQAQWIFFSLTLLIAGVNAYVAWLNYQKP